MVKKVGTFDAMESAMARVATVGRVAMVGMGVVPCGSDGISKLPGCDHALDNMCLDDCAHAIRQHALAGLHASIINGSIHGRRALVDCFTWEEAEGADIAGRVRAGHGRILCRACLLLW